MAFSHGSKAKVRLDNSAGVLTDVSTWATNVQMPRSIETADVSTFGLTAKQHIPGLEDGTITIDFKYDPTIDTQLDSIKFGLAAGGSVSWQYDPQGTATGLPRYTAELYMTGYNVTTPIGDAASISATFQVTGGITRAVQ